MANPRKNATIIPSSSPKFSVPPRSAVDHRFCSVSNRVETKRAVSPAENSVHFTKKPFTRSSLFQPNHVANGSNYEDMEVDVDYASDKDNTPGSSISDASSHLCGETERPVSFSNAAGTNVIDPVVQSPVKPYAKATRRVKAKEMLAQMEESPSKANAKPMNEETNGSKDKIFIMMHACEIVVGTVKGLACCPVRIFAGKFMLQLKETSSDVLFSYRFNCKDITSLKANFTAHPYSVALTVSKVEHVNTQCSKEARPRKSDSSGGVRVNIMLSYEKEVPTLVSSQFKQLFTKQFASLNLWTHDSENSKAASASPSASGPSKEKLPNVRLTPTTRKALADVPREADVKKQQAAKTCKSPTSSSEESKTNVAEGVDHKPIDEQSPEVRMLHLELRRKSIDLERHRHQQSAIMTQFEERQMSMQQTIEVQSSELNNLQMEVSELKTNNQSLQSEADSCSGELDRRQSELVQLRDERDRLATELGHERSLIEKNQQLFSDLSGDLDRKIEEIHRLRTEVSREQHSRTSAEERLQEARQQVDFLQMDVARLETLTLSQKRQIDNYRRQITELNRTIESQNGEITRHENEEDPPKDQKSVDWIVDRHQISITDVVLGRGALGIVKKGKFRGSVVAVKQIHQLILSRYNRRLFEREMSIAAQCRHPSLLQFIGATNDDGSPLFVTELMRKDLRSLLSEQRIQRPDILTIGLDILSGLCYLHLSDPVVIHRDISSSNILLWQDRNHWRAKLSDFGSANFMALSMTLFPGGPLYSPPEAGIARHTPKLDIFSFGILLCEMCLGLMPDPDRRQDQIESIADEDLRLLVSSCTSLSPEQRPNALELVTTFESLLERESNSTPARET